MKYSEQLKQALESNGFIREQGINYETEVNPDFMRRRLERAVEESQNNLIDFDNLDYDKNYLITKEELLSHKNIVAIYSLFINEYELWLETLKVDY